MMRARILGSGTSNGVPMLGVKYPQDFLSNPKNHRTRCSLLLQSGDGNVLVDCAPEMRLQLLAANVFELEAVIISHTHADHIMGMDDLRSFCIMQKKEMPLYTLPRYQDDIRRIFPYAFQEFPAGIEVPRFSFQTIEDSGIPKKIKVAGMEIQPLLVEHGAIPTVALRVNDFAYITDVSRIPPESWEHLQGLETLILDAVRIRPHPNHFHLEAALEVAAKLGAKQTYFTHLSHDYDHDLTNSQLPPGIELAWDGLEIEI